MEETFCYSSLSTEQQELRRLSVENRKLKMERDASNAFCNLLKKYDITGSMSGKGNCYDNAVAKSFFATLKNERVWFRRYGSWTQARIDIVDYIPMYYNCKCLHSTLGYLSPDRFENRNSNSQLESLINMTTFA